MKKWLVVSGVSFATGVLVCGLLTFARYRFIDFMRGAYLDSQLFAIAELEESYRSTHGGYLACESVPLHPPANASLNPWPGHECFDRLGFRPEAVRCSYSVETIGDQDFLVMSYCADGDGIAVGLLRRGARRPQYLTSDES